MNNILSERFPRIKNEENDVNILFSMDLFLHRKRLFSYTKNKNAKFYLLTRKLCVSAAMENDLDSINDEMENKTEHSSSFPVF